MAEDDAADPALVDEVRSGLTRTPKELPTRLFYDEEGSRLFERITELPEYYLTRTEAALLREHARDWLGSAEIRAVVELGPGGAGKTRLVLDALRGGGPIVYLPVDVSRTYLQAIADGIGTLYGDVDVQPVLADMTVELPAMEGMSHPALVAFLGSTIGNFEGASAELLLRRIAGVMRPGDLLLLGADLRPGPGKTREELEAAYNDAAGVTAAFNLNLLRAVNRAAGTDFDPAAYDHRAFYDDAHGRIEMHLVARWPHRVTIDGTSVAVRAGESIRTEISCKYDRDAVEALLATAGLRLSRWATDDRGRFAIALAAPA